MAQFPPGQSGNKRGRPAGAKNKSTPAMQEFAKSIVDSDEYRARLQRQAIAGELHPKLEEKLLNYAYPEQKQERTTGITVNLGIIAQQGAVPTITIDSQPIPTAVQIDSPRLLSEVGREKAG